MSDDLISRKAVIAAVDRHTREDGTLDDDISVILEEVKTAFDKKKVIEKLQQERDDQLKNWEENLFWNESRMEEGTIKGLSIAIKAVEKGGIE